MRPQLIPSDAAYSDNGSGNTECVSAAPHLTVGFSNIALLATHQPVAAEARTMQRLGLDTGLSTTTVSIV
jgi:hypothetical protein